MTTAPKRRWGVLLLFGVMVGLSGCDEEFYRIQREWLAYTQSPAYHETTTYGEYHGPGGSTYCTQVCNRTTCRTTCKSY